MRNAKLLEDRPISEQAKHAELIAELYTPTENDVEVTIEVEPEAYGLIFDFRPSEEPIAIDKFTKQFKVLVGDLSYLGRIISRFGGAARVVAPQAAKDAVRDFALRALEGEKTRTPKDAE